MAVADADGWDGKVVQYGTMHEAIGRQQHHGRVQLKRLLERPHFYGVAALAKLEGEVTILDGEITMTRVDAEKRLQAAESALADQSATLLVGGYVPAWSEHKAAKNVTPEDFDSYLAELAAKSGLDTARPFVFTLEGELSDVRLHVIHGACPLHARLQKIELPKEQQPFEADFEKVRGKVVGVFAKNAVGNITHPATSTHMHLVFTEEVSGKTVTGHVEKLGLRAGATVRFPIMK